MMSEDYFREFTYMISLKTFLQHLRSGTTELLIILRLFYTFFENLAPGMYAKKFKIRFKLWGLHSDWFDYWDLFIIGHLCHIYIYIYKLILRNADFTQKAFQLSSIFIYFNDYLPVYGAIV